MIGQSQPASDPCLVVAVHGEADLGTLESLFTEIDGSLAGRSSVIVDFSDCTFLDLATLRRLREAYERAYGQGLRFAAVLPFSAAPSVRRLVLELAWQLAEFPIFPSRAAADLGLRRGRGPLALERMRKLRADIWANGVRREELLARRDELILEQRLLAARRSR